MSSKLPSVGIKSIETGLLIQRSIRAVIRRHVPPIRWKTTDARLPSPLEGVRVLDLTRILAGPYCAQILGDLGADVIKVEKPGHGDDSRTWGPPFVDGDSTQSVYFLCANRNKRSVVIDMKKGSKLIQQLAEKSDVLIENYVPGTLEKMGLDYDTLRSLNPKLIYCSITGYGPDGPYSKKGGYDVIAASIGGLLHITGPQDGQPCKVGVAMTDLATALYAHGAIMAALLQRQKTNVGQKIDCNLLSTQIASLANIGSNYLNAGLEARRWGTAHETIVPYEAFETKDGRWITIGAGNNVLFKELCNVLDLSDLADDAKYASNGLRVANRKELLSQLRARLKEEDCQVWLQRFDKCKFPNGSINDMEHAFNDPQVKHNNLVYQMGDAKFVGPPVRYSGSENTPRLPPPKLGEHTRDVLENVLGVDKKTVDILYQEGVVQ